MIEISVKVSGPGGCISREIQTVYDALVRAGAKVTVIKPPKNGVQNITITGTSLDSHIELICDEQPWGG